MKSNNIVIDIGKKLNMKLTKEDIDASHRLSNLPSAGIIVKFASRRKRDEFLEKSKKEKFTWKKLDIEDDDEKKVFINESLTKLNKQILKQCKEELKDQFKWIWVKRGKIYIREKDNSKIMEIKSLEHISKLSKIYDPVDD